MKLNDLSKSLKISLMCGVAVSGFAVTGAMAQDAAQADEDADTDVIYVTSRKRQELLIEVPMNIAVVGAEEINHRNLINKEDAFRTIAGAASPRGQLILRGLSGGNDSTPDTTATWTDGVPFDFSNLYDVERIEVLRGPQGTLWGSNAIGGTVQVITNKPDLDDIDVTAQLLVSHEKNRPGITTRASAMVNIPIVEGVMALRVTGSSGQNEGKILNTWTGTTGKENDYYVRTQLGWEPNEDTRINLTWVNTHDYDSAGEFVDVSNPTTYYNAILTPNAGATYGYDVELDFPSCPAGSNRVECMAFAYGGGLLNGHNPDFAEWRRVDAFDQNDYNVGILSVERDNLISGVDFVYTGSFQKWTNLGRQGWWSRADSADMFRTWIIDVDGEDRWTHEMRFQSSDIDSPLQWTVGAYYDKQSGLKSPDIQWQYHDADNRSRAIADYLWGYWWGLGDPTMIGETLYGDGTKNYNYQTINWVEKELALFGEASYTADMGDNGRLEFTGGLRYFNLKDDLHDRTSGVWVDAVDLEIIDTITKDGEDGFRKKAALNYMPNDNFAIFAIYSEGYRRGGNNGPTPPGSCLADPAVGDYVNRYTSDAIKNYEVGVKGFAMDRKIRFSAAAYQIDWTDVQAQVRMATCGFAYTSNAATARSKGFEFESTSNLTDSLKVIINGSYTSSKMTSDAPAIKAFAGDDMTMVPKYNYYIALDQSFTYKGREGYVRLGANGYGQTVNHFRFKDTDVSPSYTVFNLSTSLQVTDYASVGLFVDNLFNTRYQTYTRQEYNSDWAAGPRWNVYGRERTVSARVDMQF